ncbi:hypothetical protein J4453_00455 [Candidatus Woesearchaeota archaeon]|nr:hypothetical protein [Candidatus Woesearchaeota archaeon]
MAFSKRSIAVAVILLLLLIPAMAQRLATTDAEKANIQQRQSAAPSGRQGNAALLPPQAAHTPIFSEVLKPSSQRDALATIKIPAPEISQKPVVAEEAAAETARTIIGGGVTVSDALSNIEVTVGQEAAPRNMGDIREEARAQIRSQEEQRNEQNRIAEEARVKQDVVKAQIEQAPEGEQPALKKQLEEAARMELEAKKRAEEADKKRLEAETRTKEAEVNALQKVEGKIREELSKEEEKQTELQNTLATVQDAAQRQQIQEQLETMQQTVETVRARQDEIGAVKEEHQQQQQQLEQQLEEKTKDVADLKGEEFKQKAREEFFGAVEKKTQPLPSAAPETRGVERALEVISAQPGTSINAETSRETARNVLENVQQKIVLREVVQQRAETADAANIVQLEAEAQKIGEEIEQRRQAMGRAVDVLGQKAAFTQANLRIEKEARVFEESDEQGQMRENTLVTITFTPENPMEDVSIYEGIPKEVASDISQLIFYSDNYEIIESDPLIVWHFAEIREPVNLAYAIRQKIAPESLETVATVAVAEKITGLQILEIIEPKQEQEESLLGILLPALLIPLIGIIVVYFNRFGPGEHAPPVQPSLPPVQRSGNPIGNPTLLRVAGTISYLRRKGYRDEDIRSELLLRGKYPRSMVLEAFKKK